jgi:apolipoprotein N-acyltransferase
MFLIALGALAGLGHAPIDWPVFTVIACALFLALHSQAATTRQAALHGFAFGVGYFAFTLRWIVSPFLVYITEDGWMAPFALILMSAGFAAFWAFAAWIAQRIRPQSACLIGLAIIGAEILRGVILTGFPWGKIGQVFIATPFAQLAAIAGPHALTGLVIGAAYIVMMLFNGKRWPFLFIIGFIGLGLWLRPEPAAEIAADAPIIRLIQPNAPQEQKWDPAYANLFFERMTHFSNKDDVPDLIVWPESSIPALLNYAEDLLVQISEAARGAPVVLGANRREGSLYYNSFLLLGHDGLVSRVYDKQHLVPFGEYIPGGELLNTVGIPHFASSQGAGFSAGDGQKHMMIPGIGHIRPLICYEGIFAHEIGASVRPEAMILITNDAWFGKDAGPFQHLAQARLRAIERGVPMIRVANTGISAMIDAKGRITGQIALDTHGYLDVPLPPASQATLYNRWGSIPFLIVYIFSTVLIIFPRRVDTG